MEFLLGLIIFVIVLYILFKSRTYRVQSAPEQYEFLKGEVPKRKPDGFYNGSLYSLKTSWLGKEFNREKSTGINHFKQGDKTIKRFPFKMHVAFGELDRTKEVLKIEYNLPKNPFWARMIVDEIVETEPHHFLGKVQIKLPKGIVFSLGYFRLEKK